MTDNDKTDGETVAKGWYVYGIVGADVEVLPETTGIGEPPAPVVAVRSGDVAALVSEIDLNRPLGTTKDLMAHQRLLDDTIIAAPVLPIRFGAVLSSKDAVREELLEPQEEAFAGALAELDGEAQYVVHARYVEERLMRDVMGDDKGALELAQRIQTEPPEATRDIRLQLGEAINKAVEERRRRDTQAVLDAVTPVTVETSIRDPVHEEDAAHVALLVSTQHASDVDSALTRLAGEWADRVTVRLTGPMAPYDFVVATSGGPSGDTNGG